jgi:SAM-dependent methyltransferase
MNDTNPTSSDSSEIPRADRSLFLALALVALCTLLYQVLLTRFLSATVYYHYAFSVIAAAMFGLTFGAVLVALNPRWFPIKGLRTQVSLAALGFSITSVITLAVHLRLCQFMSSQIGPVLVSIFLLAAIPFTCSGIVICLILTRHSRQSGPLYAADLAGSAAGCLFVALLFHFTDGIGALFLCAATATLAGAWPSRQQSRRVWLGCLAASLILFSLAAAQTSLWHRHESLLPITHSKGYRVLQPLFERWNTHSRVTVTPHDDIPFGWGLYPGAVRERRIEQRYLEMDSNASTIITRFNGDLSTVDYLRHDIINAGHVLGPGGKVLVIGVGGGRDILSALVAGRDQIVGVEINPDIIRAVTRDFAEFSGNLAKHPKVRIEINDARSFAAGTDESFDMIQVSLVDTWAATAAGALVLTENSLYTLEAWGQFLDRLSDNGVLSFSRWFSPELPYESYRLFNLALESLRSRGITEPLDHLVILTSPPAQKGIPGIATLLASRRPFTPEEISRLQRYAGENGFTVVLAPGSESGGEFRDLTTPEGLLAAEKLWYVDLSPPTDNSPFFFEFSHPRDLFGWRLWSGHKAANLEVPRQMLALLILVTALVCLCIIIPLQTKCCDRSSPLIPPGLVFFSAIGFGFMHVEISLIQRLVVLLGNPTQSLTVVLFTLLLASGAGSWFWGRQLVPGDSRSLARFMAALLVSLGIIGLATPWLVANLMPASGIVRIAVSALLVGWAGFFMGGAMPWALQSTAPLGRDTTSWFWGVNGATSVSATVSAVVISLFMGISAAYWTGWVAYVVAALAAWQMLKAGRRLAK